MSIHSQLPYDQSTSHARIPAGGINLIASIDSASEAQVTASFFGSTKALHGEVATTSPATTTHNHSNQQYSITAVTTSAGAIAERYAYSAYGEPTILDGSGSVIASSAISNRYSYTGREWDATVGLYHFRARWMSPKSGRFLTRDPIGYKLLSLYLYVSNNPHLYSDPSGHMPQMVAGALAGCGAAGISAGIGSAIVNLPNIGKPGSYCCSVGCDSLGGCVSGAIFGAIPSVATGCIGGAIGSLVGSLCNNACQGTPIDGCTLFSAAVSAVMGCIGGAAADADGDNLEIVMNLIGLNVGIWSGLCSAAGGGGGPAIGGGPVCCTFESGGTIWSETVTGNFGEDAGGTCARAADGWLWDYQVIASRSGGCGR
jgi:RHS repeat-associated protein